MTDLQKKRKLLYLVSRGTVRIRRVSDGVTVEHKFELDRKMQPEDMLKQWTPGGPFSCDCTRHRIFELHHGNSPFREHPCGASAYQVVRLETRDGIELYPRFMLDIPFSTTDPLVVLSACGGDFWEKWVPRVVSRMEPDHIRRKIKRLLNKRIIVMDRMEHGKMPRGFRASIACPPLSDYQSRLLQTADPFFMSDKVVRRMLQIQKESKR